MIITNFKTYESATGDNAVVLAKIHEEVAQQTGADIRIVVQLADLYRISKAVNIPVYAQHIDPVEFGGHTGAVLPEAVKGAGATGTLLNHSERRLERSVLEASVKRVKELGLKVILCAKDADEGAGFLSLEPDFIAIEPPELIGGDVSVSNAQPELIVNAAEKIGKKKLLVGAGVKNSEDVRKAMNLGACGVLLASGIAKAEDPKSVLMDLVKGLS